MGVDPSGLIENAADIFVVLENGVVRYVNRAVESTLGYSTEALLGYSFYGFIHSADLESARAALVKPGSTFEARFRHHGGRWVTLEAATGQQMAEGMVVSLRDTDERRRRHERLEHQLRQSQKMDAVGRLASGVAHDFNNLLTAINGYAELALVRMSGDELRRPLEEIKKAGKRAAEITRRLLTLSRHQNVMPRRLDLNLVVVDMEKLLKRVLGEDVDLTSHLDLEIQPILADPSQIEQIILNLSINARDAMPEGGQLIIETRSVSVPSPALPEELEDGDYALLVISDSGGGMEPEVLEHAFEPFFTTKGNRHNAGLGLSIVYGIVKQSGGHVDVESTVDLGTSFRLYFPHLADEAVTVEEEVPKPMTGGQEQVLLVEDEEPVRELVHQILEDQGYQVAEAPSAETALALCEHLEGEPDLLLTDVVMPGESGVELAETLQRRYPAMRILFMSGYTDSHAEIRRLARRGASFLPKPFTPEELTRRIRKVLDARS